MLKLEDNKILYSNYPSIKKKWGQPGSPVAAPKGASFFFFFHNKLVVLFRFDFNKCVREKIWLGQFGKRIKKNSNLTLEAY